MGINDSEESSGSQESTDSHQETAEGTLEFWELPERFSNLALSEADCEMVMRGANDDVSDWKKITLQQ